MCGIAGIVNFKGEIASNDILRAMTDAEKHRGPDDFGIYSHGQAGLAHRRLSIIDLSQDARQPMANEDGTVYIVHNGEVYNYLELKCELEGIGHRFRSKSDTEVILHSYEEWGSECLGRFNGMWSFAILDLRKNELFCARDRFGVKPFYYCLSKDIFVFASEIKALMRHPKIIKKPNDSAIFNYLASGYGYMDVSDDTFFVGIKQLKPSHYLEIDLGGERFVQKKYWDLGQKKKGPGSSPAGEASHRAQGQEKIVEEFYRIFEDAVRLRLRSDVPLGVSLSGGLDSSSIACVASMLLKGATLETFSSCFDEGEYDERKFIHPVLEVTNSRANFIFAKPDKLFSEIEDIIWHQEEPYSTLSIFPQWYVMKLAREKGVKVLLTGQGGDETLAGYHKYYCYLFADLIYDLKWGSARNEMSQFKNIQGKVPGASEIARIITSYAMPQVLKKISGLLKKNTAPNYISKDFKHQKINRVSTEKKFQSILNNDLYNALKISPLPSLLHIDDRSSMAHSVESRAPFLDYRLVEYLFSLGPEYKIRDGMTKYILRAAMKGTLPEEVRMRRDKMGFATPLEKWFRTNLKDKVHEIINSAEFSSRPYFDQDNVRKAYDAFLAGDPSVSHYAVWSWVNLELWMRRFF